MRWDILGWEKDLLLLKVARCCKKSLVYEYKKLLTSLVFWPPHRPVFDRFQAIKTEQWEGLGMRLTFYHICT